MHTRSSCSVTGETASLPTSVWHLLVFANVCKIGEHGRDCTHAHLGTGRRDEASTTALGSNPSVELPLSPTEPLRGGAAVSKRRSPQRRCDRHNDATPVRGLGRAAQIRVGADADTQSNCARHGDEEVPVSGPERCGQALGVPFKRHEQIHRWLRGRSRVRPLQSESSSSASPFGFEPTASEP